MRCVMVMFDSLNRHMLPPYDPSTWVQAPNFRRLAQRTATFDKSYVCSMPCMPARRELHTARPNFLHTGWGPLEPFDDSVPAMLSKAGIYTHLCTDHYHYFEDGGATYHTRYDSWEFFRGQEGDAWMGQVAEPAMPANINGKGRRQDWVNRPFMTDDEKHPQTGTFDAGLSFIERNHAQDNWFLQIETFDPHEPFVVDPKYRDLYPPDPLGLPLFDWPGYQQVKETPEQVEACRRNYAALVSKCDASLGRVLDAFDRHDLWKDTMLIIWTDHGFLLGEHNWWAKNVPPMYEEISHTPLFIHDPRTPDAAGQRRAALVQPALDLGPTLLGLFKQAPTERMLGRDLAATIADDTAVREYAIFGQHASYTNITDGRYVYLRDRATENNGPLFSYTLMPTAMRGFRAEWQRAALVDGFSFTHGHSILRLPFQETAGPLRENARHLLFDLQADPAQAQPLSDPGLEQRMLQGMSDALQQCEAPPEQYIRHGLPAPRPSLAAVR